MSDSAPPPPTPRPFYKDREFWAGLVGWYVINGAAWLLWGTNTYGTTSTCGLFLLPANLLVWLILLLKRRRLAGGITVAIAFNLMVSLVLGLFTNAVCSIPFFIPFD